MEGATRSSAYRQILRTTAIIGGASAANVLIGLIRNKAAALMLGPAGVGSIGLLLNIVLTVAGLAGMGVAMASVRTFATPDVDCSSAEARRALTVLTTSLAIVGAVAIWLFREPVARYALGNAGNARMVGWLAPAIALTIWSGAQLALLNGLRRIGDLARVQIVGSSLGTVLGLAALGLWRENGTLAYVLASPLSMVIAGFAYTRSLPIPALAIRPSRVRAKMFAFLRLGIPMMLGATTLPLGLLAVRAITDRHLGGVALGQFTAAWTLSVTYVSLVLSAMGTDYFPRLSAIIGDKDRVVHEINSSIEVSMFLSLPLMMAMQALSPWLLSILYSSSFTGASSLLRIQVAGDVLKVVSWPFAFVLLALGRGFSYWLVESSIVAALVVGTYLTVPVIGLMGIGIGYLIGYLVYFCVLYVMMRRRFGFRFLGITAGVCSVSIILVTAVAIVGSFSAFAALISGLSLAGITGVVSFLVLSGRFALVRERTIQC